MLEVDEGDPFNKLLHAKSINNLKARGIFSNVDKKILEGSSPDLKVLEQPKTNLAIEIFSSDNKTMGKYYFYHNSFFYNLFYGSKSTLH